MTSKDSGMRWCSMVSRSPVLADAIAEAVEAVAAALGPRPDLLVTFVSPHHQASFDRVPRLLGRTLTARTSLGCTAGGVIGGGREIEDAPGVSVTGAILPGVRMRPFEVGGGVGSPALAGSESFLLFADPFTFDAESFLHDLDLGFPSAPKVGGLASGGLEAGGNALIFGDGIRRAGLVGVGFSGAIDIDTVVAQGCRPIGEPMFVTGANRNVITGLDGRTPIEVLRDLFEHLDARDRELFRHSLFLGVVMRAKTQAYRQGDFLIRNVIGIAEERQALGVGAVVPEGAIVQFHLRDAETSARDLDAMLGQVPGETREKSAGALLFSCLGRGRQLYGRPDHDTDVFRRHLGDVPLGGFFCNGEIGPVHGQTFLHGYTSSFGLFRPR